MTDLLLFPELLAAAINGWVTAFLVARAPREAINRIMATWCFLMCWWGLCYFAGQVLANADMRVLFRHAAIVGWLFSGALFYQTVRIRILGGSLDERRTLVLYSVPAFILLLQLLPDPITETIAGTSFGFLLGDSFQRALYDVHLVGVILLSARCVRRASRQAMFNNVQSLRVFVTSFTSAFLVADAIRLWVQPEWPPISPLANAFGAVILLARYGRTGRTLLTAPSAAEEIVQIITYVIVVSDVRGSIRMANPSAVRMLGYPEETLLEMNVNDIVRWDRAPDPDRYSDPRSPRPSARAAMTTSEGTSIPVIATETVVWSELGSPMAVILVASDARDLLRQEEERAALKALRESEGHFRSLIENASDMISIVDSDGRLRYHSPSVERVLGMAQSEMIDVPITDLLHRDDISGVLALLQSGVPAGAEFRLRHKDGTWRYLEATVNPMRLRDNGAAFGGSMIINSRDITERKRLEAQLMQSQKMEAVGRLAGGVAHDFNNMLTAIKGYSDLLLADPDNSSETLRADLNHIRNAANRAALLTQQLLAFSRRQIMAPRVIDLNAIAGDMESMLRRLIGEDIELVFELDPDLSCVKADPGQLQQVIMNLGVNARDAMPKGGCLTLQTVNCDVEGETIDGIVPPGRYARMRFSDTGSGMTNDVMSHIFEPFFTTKEAGKGTGLGLATVYGVVKQSGGFILVNSVLGQGAIFDIYLPRVDAPAEPVGLPAPIDKGGGRETILLVEDEPDVRRVARRSLERRGYKVLEADCGSRALELSEQHAGTIHLLLTDVVMPQMSGVEVADQITAARPDVQVLYMSGYTDQILAEQRLASSDHFLPKPFTPAILQDRVRQLLDYVQAAPAAGVTEKAKE